MATSRYPLRSSDLIVGFKSRSENYFRKSINLDEPINPYTSSTLSLTTRSYAGLGTVSDVDDTAIINAYSKQVQDDPANIVFYLECLQDIGSSLQNRKINQFADKQVVNGVFTRFDLQRAYRTLEIDHPDEIDDEGVIAVFQSRCADAPGRERDFQSALDVIQHFRRATLNSGGRRSVERRGMIFDEFNNVEMDAPEAYRRLRINDVNLSDDLIIASFVSCVCS